MAVARLGLTAFDARDPHALAVFYQGILGGTVDDGDDEWIELATASGTLGFQLAPGNPAPTWPDPAVPQQLHLDLMVPDLDAAERAILALGARSTGLPDPAEHRSFRVYLDPEGHPFCLVRA